MALETFDYPDGTTSIAGTTPYVGTYEIQGGVLTPASTPFRLAWPSQRNGTWSVTIDPASSQNGNAGFIIRGSDANNYLSFFFRSSDGLVRGGKFVNGSNTEILNSPTSGYSAGEARTFTVEAYGENIDVFVDGKHRGRYIDDSGLTGSDAGLRSDSTAYSFDDFRLQDPTPLIPNGDPLVPLTYSGKKRQLTKLGKLLTTHSSILASGAPKELHPSLLDMNGVANWPYAKYPFILATSSDHSGESGGIYIRVFNSELGGFATSSAWEEWQDVSNRSEFSHINKKTNPIYVDSVSGQQTETPYLKVEDGVVHLFYHNRGVFVSGSGFGQATSLATSTNGIDFSRSDDSPILSYNPKYGMGNFHTGYMSVTESILPDFPYSKIAMSAHGGGAPILGSVAAIWGTEDYIKYSVHSYISRIRGEAIEFNPPTWGEANTEWIIMINWAIHLLKKEGPYYRMVFQIRPDIGVGGVTGNVTICEVLIDKDFNVVSDINYFLPLGADGEFDDHAIINYHTEVNYLGTTYALYLANESDSVSSIGIATVEEVDHDWSVIRPLGGKTSIVEEKVNGTTLPSLTYSHAASVQTTAVGDEAVMTIPAGGAVASATSSPITLSDYDVIDFHVGSIAKNADINIEGRAGFYDDPYNPQNGVGLYWYPDSYVGGEKRFLALEVIENGVSRKVQTYRALGQLAEDSPNLYESPEARLDVGIRVDAARRKVFVMTGQNENSNDSLYGLDVDTPLTPMLAFSTTEAADEQIYFDDFRVTSYANQLQIDEGVNDTVKPVITVSGSPTTTIQVGDPAPSFIASAVDNLDGDLTSSLVVTGDTVPVDGDNNTTVGGTYTIRWNVSDSNDNPADEVTRTVIVEAAQQVNQPPVANAGPDQSVAAATQFTLDGTGSQDTDGTIVEWRWTQTAGDTVTLNLDDPARPTATSPSKTTAQRLTFQLVTVDDEGAESSPGTVNIDVAAFAVSEMLKLLDTRQWTVVNDGSVQAFEGRSNREAFRFQVTPSDGIQTSAEGYFLFDQPGVHAVEVISTPTSKISSVDDPHMIRGDVIAARIGDLQTDENGNLTLTFVLYVTDDKDGLVMTAKVIEPYQKASYFRKQG